jgi:hypothetical protein
MPLTSLFALSLPWACPQIVRCTTVSEHIPMLGPQFSSKLEGDPRVGPPSRWSRGRSRRAYSAHAAGASDGVAADLTGALVEDEVAPAGEADLGAVAAGAGPVQVVERGRVGNVLVVDDEEVAGGVLAVGAAVDGPGPVQGADNEGGVDVALDVVTPAMEPVVWMVRL